MPLTRLQSRIMGVIAGQRDAESFIAGGVSINRDGPRYSSDIDTFHDREQRMIDAAGADAKLLAAAGFEVEWSRQLPAIQTLIVCDAEEATRIEWVADSDYRFFPATADPEFGFVLDVADLAVNKLMAAAGRREPRDVVDLVTIHERHLPVGAVAWAAVDVAPGFTPEGLLAEVRRNARYSRLDFAALASSRPIDADALIRTLREAIDSAEAFVAAMPSEKAGLLFLENGRPVQPDPSNLGGYHQHRAQRRGHWPSSSEIGSAMLERYAKPGDK